MYVHVHACTIITIILIVDEVTTAWLQMMDDVILGYGEPTYSALASALDEAGHSAVAKRIRDNGGRDGNGNKYGLCIRMIVVIKYNSIQPSSKWENPYIVHLI
jgi:hypothetical protein